MKNHELYSSPRLLVNSLGNPGKSIAEIRESLSTILRQNLPCITKMQDATYES